MKSEKDPHSLAALTPPGEHQSPIADPFDLGAFNPPSIEELDQQIPAYEFLEFIDRGGMGAVYRARQRSLNRVVAIKLLPVSLRNRRVFAERFGREARALALLNHPNIVSVYDSGEASGGCLYYAMEYVKGTNLRRFMKEGRATAKQLLNIAMQVCEALQFAHSRGVVHRDVKPANILIDENGRAKVADFGLAKVIGAPPQHLLTGASDALGTPDYMAPEAVTRDYEVDHRADIYSLGVMLYEMLTNHVPKGAWEPPSRAVGVDERFDEVVSRALQVDPKRRYQSVGDLSTVVRQLIDPITGAAPNPSPLERTPVPGDPDPPASPSATTVHLRKKPRGPWWRNLSWGFSTLSLLALGYFIFGDSSGVMERARTYFFGMTPSKEMAPSPSATHPPPQTATAPSERREAQAALARTVFARGGTINYVTEGAPLQMMGGEYEIRSEVDLPKEDFEIWRISFHQAPAFRDQDLAVVVDAAAIAGSVQNLNLASTKITSTGLGYLSRLAESLTSLNLKDTQGFNEGAVESLAALRNLRLLRINAVVSDPNIIDVGPELRLINQLQNALPDLKISEY
ncbi:serine/threonine protein kinase [Roseimicrobium gellanilyticum]|uniref:Serine/threonine protein kinase n=1 Tax=Roseimicrobium gellanilyticum TaxID=748857 RepID=A0A366HBF8_9BACT|nr:serine/threonine-protein kinase [Roseimicrobium gellanilyticum]RBP39702.1 serine/threonine protein kinase [Roseimicrobium gellanilyticum]